MKIMKLTLSILTFLLVVTSIISLVWVLIELVFYQPFNFTALYIFTGSLILCIITGTVSASLININKKL